MKNICSRIAVLAIAATVAAPMPGCRKKTELKPVTRNIILMIGDGMGTAHITALMLDGRDGNAPINMTRAKTSGLVMTYSANNRVTDSAAAATAYSTGEKTNNSYLGVDPDGAPLETILEKAEKAGMSTGIVATTRITHATPGAFYAHTIDRNNDDGIALELLGADIDIAICGGIEYMTMRADGRNLMDEMRTKGYIMTDTLPDLDGVTGGNAMVLYDENKVPKYLKDGRDPMMLAKGTAKALEIITSNSADRGFFMMVEGSWIDSAGHGNDAEMLLGEMLDFDNAVGVAMDYADTHPGTLVIVVADHETGGLTIPAGKENFLLPDSGVEFRWSTGGHTGTMVPMLAYGTGASYFGGIMENTEVNRRMEEILGL